jgi:3-oxoadipate enol-lactonase
MFVSSGDAKIFTTGFGPKSFPALVAIGGWIGSWELWTQPFLLLSQKWRTIGYDHRGAGATVAPVESITFERLVDDVFAVLDSYEVEQCVLAAESAGALTALGAALRQPHRVIGLVIVDGLYSRDPVTEQDPFLSGLRSDYPAFLDWFVEACVPEPDTAHIKRWGRQILDRAPQEAAIALHLASRVDLRKELPRITQPTLILHGELDAIQPMEQSQWLAETLPNAKLVILEGAGHVPTMTYPLQVAREIMDFFPVSK